MLTTLDYFSNFSSIGQDRREVDVSKTCDIIGDTIEETHYWLGM